MVRRPKRERKGSSAPPPRGTSDRDKAVDALMALLAEQSFEQIGLAEVAGQAGIKLSQLRAEFGSTLAILSALLVCAAVAPWWPLRLAASITGGLVMVPQIKR